MDDPRSISSIVLKGQAAQVEDWRTACPYYTQYVPREWEANLAFRREMLRMGIEGTQADREELWIMCARDILFWVNTFILTYHQKPLGLATAAAAKASPDQPFITYDFQNELLMEMQAALGSHDLFIEKSREMGGSYCPLICFQHDWQFNQFGNSFLLGSRKEELVDKKGNPTSLFWKLDYMIRQQPRWMVPRFERTSLTLKNLWTNATILGESCNENFARGGRYRGIFPDEFAAVDNSYLIWDAIQHATASAFPTSTPRGASGCFYDLRETSGIRVLRLHWTAHPAKSEGWYIGEDGQVVASQEGYNHPKDYPFICDGTMRSPWFDKECRRASSPVSIATELQIDYKGSGYSYFDHGTLNRVRKEHCMEPWITGELDYDPMTGETSWFEERAKGRFKLWFHPDGQQKPPRDRDYFIGCDPSPGSGAANGALVAIDGTSGEKILEFADPYIQPQDFARLAVAVCKWLNHGYLIWEANGPGLNFTPIVVEMGYGNVYYREKNLRELNPRTSDEPGFWTTGDSKQIILGELRRAMGSGEYVERSTEAVKECGDYCYIKGQIGHQRASTTPDPTGAKDNHADRVIATALAWRMLRDHMRPTKFGEQTVPDNCFGARRDHQRAKMSRDGLARYGG